MDNERKMTFQAVGQIWAKKDDSGKSYIRLGNDRSKDPKYNYTVEVIVKDANGQEILRVENPFLNVNSPHPSAAEKVPSLLAELSISKK